MMKINELSGYLVFIKDQRRGKGAHFVCEQFSCDILMTSL